MSSHLNRPIIGLSEDGERVFRDPGDLLHRVTLRVSLYEAQTRAELLEWRPGLTPEGHLVWQYHTLTRNKEHTASLGSTQALARTAEYLAKEGWPGIRF